MALNHAIYYFTLYFNHDFFLSYRLFFNISIFSQWDDNNNFYNNIYLILMNFQLLSYFVLHAIY